MSSDASAFDCCGLHPGATSLLDLPLRYQRFDFSPLDITMAKQAISTTQEQIEAIDRALDRLLDSKVLMEEHLARQMACIAPVHRVHDEILLLIFKMTVVQDIFAHPPLYKLYSDFFQNSVAQFTYLRGAFKLPNVLYRACGYPTPWAASAVCRRCRDLSLASPNLWARTIVAGRSIKSKVSSSTAYHLGLQLEKSGNVRIAI